MVTGTLKLGKGMRVSQLLHVSSRRMEEINSNLFQSTRKEHFALYVMNGGRSKLRGAIAKVYKKSSRNRTDYILYHMITVRCSRMREI